MAALSLNDKAKNLLEYANKNRKSGLFNDISIEVGNERFPCNKMVLSCFSTYFQTMFRTEMQERYQDTIELQGFDGEYIKMLIDYMYGETIEIDDENVVQVLAAADYVQLQDVKDFCIEYFTTSLSIANCLDALTAYNLYMPKLSRDHIYLFISEHFDAVFKQEKFKNLAINDLTTLLDKLNKNEVNQELMFSAIISWVKHSEETRKDKFPSLFDLLELSKLSLEFIQIVLMNNPLVSQNNRCLKSIIMSFTYKSIYLDCKPASIMECSTILCLGGENEKSVVEIFNISGKPKAKYPDLPKAISWHCAAKVDNVLYCIGGQNPGNPYSANVYRLCFTDRVMKWTEVASINESRRFHAASVFNENVLVCGGCDMSGNINSTEVYEIDANNWRTLQSLNNDNSGHALVVCNNRLAAVCLNGVYLQLVVGAIIA